MCQAGTVPHAGDILNIMDTVLAIVNLTVQLGKYIPLK